MWLVYWRLKKRYVSLFFNQHNRMSGNVSFFQKQWRKKRRECFYQFYSHLFLHNLWTNRATDQSITRLLLDNFLSFVFLIVYAPEGQKKLLNTQLSHGVHHPFVAIDIWLNASRAGRWGGRSGAWSGISKKMWDRCKKTFCPCYHAVSLADCVD